MDKIQKIQKQIEAARKCLDDLIHNGADPDRVLEQSQKVDELIAQYYEST